MKISLSSLSLSLLFNYLVSVGLALVKTNMKNLRPIVHRKYRILSQP